MAKGAIANAANLIAVHESSQTAGLITWWTLGGVINMDVLAASWAAAGFDAEDLPSTPSTSVALRRALRELYPRAQVIPLPKTPGYVVSEQDFEPNDEDGKPDPVQRVLFKAWLEDGTVRIKAPEHLMSDGLRRKVWDAHQRHQSELDASHDISPWLITMADKFHGITLRQSGGVYFIPSTHTERWRLLTTVIESCSKSTLYEIPAMRTEKAVDAILTSLHAEVMAEVAKLEEQLSAGEMGLRALRFRKTQTEDLMTKVSSYEKLLGARLQDLTSATQEVQDKVTQALLAVE